MNTVREGKVDVGKCSLSGPAPPSRGSNAEGGLIESSPHELDRLAARFRTEGSLFVTRHSEATARSSCSNQPIGLSLLGRVISTRLVAKRWKSRSDAT